MTEWFQGLAVGFGILLGLVQPAPEFRESFALHQRDNAVWLAAELPGAGSSEVEKFLTSGSPLVLVERITWGHVNLLVAHRLTYQAWQDVWLLSDAAGQEMGRWTDRRAAIAAWSRFAPVRLGGRSELEAALRTPLRVVFQLELEKAQPGFDPMSLWSYKVPEGLFLYFDWAEVPL